MDPVSIAAIGWGFSAAGWLISPVLSRFLNKCFDALDIDPKFQSRKKILLEKLENLQTTLLPKLLILTDAAKQSDHRPLLNKWLKKLKSAFYEAEHVLSLVEYRRLEKEVNSLFPSTCKSNFKKLIGKLPKFSSEKKHLIESLENLEKIVDEAMEFVPLLNLPSSSGNNSTLNSNEQNSETTATPGSNVIGRDRDRKHIVNLLRENILESTSDVECYSVIGIWGMGGSGKTTLAQYVCEYEKKDKYFDCVLWAYVSEKFSVHAVLKKILESACKKPCPDYSSLEGLQSKLEEELRGKMFFLVLDNIWCDKGVSERELMQLFSPLKSGKSGSKILVTTRNEEAARALGAMDPMKLPELAYEDFLSLFMTHAFRDVKVDEDLKKRLRTIGKQIVGKLCRSPLAATTVAGRLRRRLHPDFWLSMLNRNLLNDTMGALFLSYQHLPPALQRCFAFCSLFPKGHQFNHYDLVNFWIALGFIETEDSDEHMKDIAKWYILELVSSSFFQIDNTNSNRYSMHDLMHELAQYVSEGEYFRIESGEKKEIPVHTRHIFVKDHMLEEYVEKICKLNDLRTIIVFGSYSDNFLLKEVDLDALFTKLRKLYVVGIVGPVVKRVPMSVIHLRNLRYLNFARVEEKASFIPANKLFQLRFLCLNGRNIPDVGRLTALQELENFHVSTNSGFELKQLELLRDLTGSLSIYGLKNVKSKEEAEQAKLSDKKGLHTLLFSWDYCRRNELREIDVEILDGLCPPPEIKELTIEEYSGKRFPSWIIEKNDNIIKLQQLKLANCGGLEALDRLNELLNLLSLTISFLPRLKRWEPLPLNLIQLKISGCLSLAFVLKEDLDMIMSTKDTLISQIVTFMDNSHDHNQYVRKMMQQSDHFINEQICSPDLKKCLEKRLDLICQLKDIYGKLSLPVNLQKLSIETCFITDTILASSLQGLTSLTDLSLKDIITITCIPKEILSCLTNLLQVSIKGCLLLTKIGGLDTHSSLRDIEINCCPNLTFETSLAVASNSNTVELTSPSCKSKTRSRFLNATVKGCMPSDDMLQDLVALTYLHVSNCPTIVDLHIDHSKELSFLELKDCPNLTSLRGLSELKSLIDLKVQSCPNLVSLRGLSELKNLTSLKVQLGCDKELDADKVPQLKELTISRWSLLEQLVSRDGFSSLFYLELCYAQQESFSQEEFEVLNHLSSLRCISFDHCKLRSLPNLLCLRSLENLLILHCENLSSLPEMPRSVQSIVIEKCDDVFTRSCQDPKHSNGIKISHIASKIII
ncbi:putative disease resistance RPP13-like protein 1 [Carex rostrata]